LRAAVEAARNQPVPSAAQEKTLRRVEAEEPPASSRLAPPPLWSRPSVALAVLAASVVISFCAGYWVRPVLQASPSPDQYAMGESRLAGKQPGQDPKEHVGLVNLEPNVNPDRTADLSVPGNAQPTELGVVTLPAVRPGSLPPPPTQPGISGGANGPITATTGTGTPTPGFTTGGTGFGAFGGAGSGTPGAGGGLGNPPGMGYSGGLGGFPGGPGGPPAGGPAIPQTPPAPPVPGLPYPGPGPVPVVGTGPTPGTGLPFNTPPVVPVAPVPSPDPSTRSPVPGEPRPTTPLAASDMPAVVVRSSADLTVQLHRLTLEQQQKFKEVAETWSKMPATQRQAEGLEKALKEALPGVPAQNREALVAAFRVQVVGADEPTNSANYNHFVDNPFQAVQNAPLSTFSTSVDTASYSNVRRFLMNENRLPPKDAVRIADMLNYFPYEYPVPKGDVPVAFAMNMATCPWNTEHQVLRVAMAAKQYTAAEMPPRNFTFLLDTSGSMSPEDRLPLLIKGFKLLVEQLRAQDRVAIVVYAGSAGLVLESTPGNEKQKILGALDRLAAGGSTNGGDGIRLAYKVAADAYIKGGVNRVILATDGDWNVGTTSQADLIRLIEEKRKTGVFLSILGVGREDLQDGMMERLAHHGAGHYCYVNTMNELKKVFVEQGGALSTVAKDVKVQIEFNPQRVAGYRLIGYENKLLRDQDFNNDAIHAGDMGSGHTVTALYEIVPAGHKVPDVSVEDLKYQKPTLPAEAANTGEFLTVKMRYKDPEAETSKKLEQPLAGAVVNFEKAPDDLRWAAAVAEFGMLLRGSPYKGTATYSQALLTAEKALGGEDTYRVEFLSLVKKARELSREADKKP
jgi:Ca-activated chloride channel family protein